MPLLVRLIDSQVEAGDGVIPQAADRIHCRGRVGEQMGPVWLAINQQAPFPDLHIQPVDGDSELGGDFMCSATLPVTGRIASPDLFPDGLALPH